MPVELVVAAARAGDVKLAQVHQGNPGGRADRASPVAYPTRRGAARAGDWCPSSERPQRCDGLPVLRWARTGWPDASWLLLIGSEPGIMAGGPG
jgi:hypothetical protein